jgi:hypothetical protein
MKTILIAHRDADFAARLTADLRAGGFHVIDCSGPQPPKERCIRCDKGYCPLTEAADVMIYDPLLSGVNAQGERDNLATESAMAHPDVPMLLAWAPPAVPAAGTLRAIRAEAPNVHVAAHDSAGLIRQIRSLLAPTAVAPR